MSLIADSKVARRYAAALFSVARKQGKADAIQRDLSLMADLWKLTPALRKTMESPLVPGERKRALLHHLFAQNIDPLTLSFLNLLVEKRREEILLRVEEEVRCLSDEANNLLRVQATVATPIDDAQRKALIDSLERRTGKRVILSIQVEPAILGGVIVRMQDTVIDGSVRGALESLREQMLRERQRMHGEDESRET
jgi:F-type H+-transporting ATPase subunit delta